MLSVNSISKSYGIETILERVSFTVNPGERLGLVGPNGCGKSTLLRILVGEEQPDQGTVRRSNPNLAVAYLPQGFTPDSQQTIAGYLAHFAGDFHALSQQLEHSAAALVVHPGDIELQQAYDTALNQLQQLKQTEQRGAAVLAALGLADVSPETPIHILSGGQKTRLSLAGILLSIPHTGESLLLLDEPTNHLDLDMLDWLEGWLLSPPQSRSAGVLLVSHDRAFLDRVATGILELDQNTHTVRVYPGNYTSYLEAKLVELEHHWQVYSDQLEEINRLKASILRVRSLARFKPGGKADSGDKFAKGFFANRSKGTIRRAKHLEAKLDNLLTDERIAKPKSDWQMKLDFDPKTPGGRDVLSLEGVAIGYGVNVLLADLNLSVRQGARVAIVGANGSGKTTLLRTIIGALPPIAGRVRLGASTQWGYMAQEQEDLNPAWNALETILHLAPFSETQARTYLHKYLFSGDDVFLPVGMLSYGERARLSLACLVAQGCNLLLLDEPINHLDIPSRTRFEQALASYEGTVLAVVHDRYFIQGFASEIWEIAAGGLNRFIVRDELLI